MDNRLTFDKHYPVFRYNANSAAPPRPAPIPRGADIKRHSSKEKTSAGSIPIAIGIRYPKSDIAIGVDSEKGIVVTRYKNINKD